MGAIKNHHDWYVDHQRELDDFVHRNIFANVSSMVSEVCSAFWEYPNSFKNSLDEDQVININQKVDESFMEDGAEPEYMEAMQHFIVDHWFAKELEKKGEIIAYDFLGLTIWGRCTYGQAISMDYVVQSIYRDLYKEEEPHE